MFLIVFLNRIMFGLWSRTHLNLFQFTENNDWLAIQDNDKNMKKLQESKSDNWQCILLDDIAFCAIVIVIINLSSHGRNTVLYEMPPQQEWQAREGSWRKQC